jgi:hypothetical protein
MAGINPFRPGHRVPTEMFAGRRAEISTVTTALRQAKAGNPSHFLVLGEPGIGKSSFLTYVEDLAAGRATHEDQGFKFLAVHTDITDTLGSAGLVRKIEFGLKKGLAQSEKTRAFFDQVWSFAQRLEAGGFGLKRAEQSATLDDPSIEEFSYSLAETVERLVDGTGPFTTTFDGLIILVDEADRLGPQLNLGAFTKNLVERLERQRCNHIVVGMAGLPSVLARLADGHQSAPRVFEHHIELSRLSRPEAAQVIQLGLDTARVQNEADIAIGERAKERILDLASGHPYLLQQIAKSAFDADLDRYIDENDVDHGLLDPNGAVEKIGNIYYKRRFATPDLDDCDRAVLRCLAANNEGWTTKEHILTKVTAEEAQVTASLRKLIELQLLQRDRTGAAKFAFTAKLFGLWVAHCEGTL